MDSSNGTTSFDPHGDPAAEHRPGEAPAAILELAVACVRHVERAVGARLDFTPETLPLLDHYLAQGREGVKARPETFALLSSTAGAYFGEVVRRRYPSWWRLDGDEPADYRLELEPVFLSFSPVELMGDALLPPDESESAGDGLEAGLELEVEDRAVVTERLANLPQVSWEEFHAPSTRLEVIDIAVEAMRARRMAAGEPADARLEPDDYL